MLKILDLAAPSATMVHSDPDQQLLARLREDDQQALRVLFDQYFELLTRIAQGVVRDREVARDVAQKVFITLWHRRMQIHVESALLPYMRRMALNEALALTRKHTRRGQLADMRTAADTVQRDVESDYLHGELSEQILQAVDELPEQCGAVFRLSRFDHLSNKEIAQSMDISVKTVENHMTRALKQLHERLRNYLGIFF